ncbi:hypothetical protein [Helicobacter pametensis]|uniref:hypothetical protein n=1 Tax=Helicobacter pametensis TaxID=95149 RepID=UPI0004803A88|nr:hypothetical protein [Helicobacter pametensis]
MKQTFFSTPDGTPIRIISPHFLQSLHSKLPNLSDQELIAHAYQSKLLDLNKAYFSFSCYQEWLQDYLSFFTESYTDTTPCTFDILLPLQFNQPMACIFLTPKQNLFCFYHDCKLLFCKEFEDDLQTCLKHVQVLFSQNIEILYCLSCVEKSDILLKLKEQHPIKPFLTLFCQELDFTLSSISTPIKLDHFHNINPNQNIKQSNHFKIFLASLGIFILIFVGLNLALIGYHYLLLQELDEIQQSTPTKLPASIDEIQKLDSQNQSYLAALFNFSHIEEQKLLILSRLLPFINPDDILSISYDQFFTFHLQNSPDLTLLFSFSNALGYRCKTSKEGETTILEISKI